MPPELSLAGRVALVTGAGRGIGAGVARVFLEAGATVVLNALTDTYLVALADELRTTHGDRVVAITGDATTPDGVAKIVARAIAEAGPIDVLVNGVGDAIQGLLVPAASSGKKALSDADITKIVDLNLMSAIYCTRAVGADMVVRRRGKVINVSSTASVRGASQLSIYAAGKAGLVGFTRSLAIEWAPYGITVNAIAPGIFPDQPIMGPQAMAYFDEHYLPNIPLARYGKPREVGLLALYLASTAGDYMTGQTLFLDGGVTA